MKDPRHGDKQRGDEPCIVILGAGFAGLTCAQMLDGVSARIILIDRNNYHCFQPLLYQVATAALAPNDIAWPIRTIVRKQRNLTVLMAEVQGIDRKGRRVTTNKGEIAFDYLVVATGATHSYFGNDAWAPFAPGLKRIEDAIGVRTRLLQSLERAECETDAAEVRRLLTFIVVGGGPTGVEMAGAIAEMTKTSLKGEFRNIRPSDSQIILLEAGARVLSSYSESLSNYAQRALVRKGVKVALNSEVKACNARAVSTEMETIPAGVVIWAAGVNASPAGQWLNADCDRAGRVKVTPMLTLPDDDRILILGDTAAVNAHGRPVPGIAPAAKQMARYAARVLRARIQLRPPPKPFCYSHTGDLATIGKNAAAVRLNSIEMKGLVAWLFWSGAHIYFLIGARNRIAVAFNWLWDYVTAQRSVRLIIDDRQMHYQKSPTSGKKA